MDRLHYRTGIENAQGEALARRPRARWHDHYCVDHDHRWACVDPCCIRHEATECWRKWHTPATERETTL